VNVGEGFSWISYLGNKFQSGSISVDEYNLSLQVVSRELFNVKVGLPETYQPGAPYPPQAYQITQKITDDLRNFIKDTTITKANGYFALPADYAAFSSLSYDYTLNVQGGQPISEKRFIDVLPDASFKSREEDNVIMPTLKYPIATYRESGILIKPKEITRATLTYLRFPDIPVFGYTVQNDEYVYDPSTSTQVDFPETLHAEFFVRVARYVGVNLRENELYAMMQERIKSGQ
jgi:hypothetical protein